MILDLVVIGAITLFAVVGAFDGALAQGARLLAIVAAGLLGRPLGALLAPVLRSELGVPTAIAEPVAVGFSSLALFLVLNFAGRRIARGLTRNHDVRAVDRSAGAFFGAIQAGVVAWIVVSLLVAVEDKAGVRPRGGWGLVPAGPAWAGWSTRRGAGGAAWGAARRGWSGPTTSSTYCPIGRPPIRREPGGRHRAGRGARAPSLRRW